MKRIPLTQGQSALVDDADFEWLSLWKWNARRRKNGVGFYAGRIEITPDGKQSIIYMHRQILGLQFGDGLQGDHKDRDSLNNQRCNLRPATPEDNQHNKAPYANNTSGLKGVDFHRASGKWRVRIRIKGSRLCLGYYATLDAASDVYRTRAAELHGEFARVI